jgi:undecaprenyl-diphosphatase
MIVLSKMGNAGAVWVVSGIALLSVKKYRWAGLAVLLALAISLVFGNGILKPLAARLRPCITYPWMPMSISVPLATDYSFPSGHTFGSFAAAAAIFSQSKRLGAAALLLATGIGFSRMYLFVHYPSDVLAGALFGTMSGIVAYRMSCYLAISRPMQEVFLKSATSAHKDEVVKH